VIAEEDLKLIVDELEITRDAAEILLKKNGGNAKSVLVSYVKNIN
jgi:phage-related protein